MKKAIYAGSFDPITYGHMDIVQRAVRIFDEVHIAVIQNPDKSSLFSLEERICLIRQVFDDQPNIIIEGFQGLLIDFSKKKKIFTVVRGLRAVSDFDFEFQMALTNRSLLPTFDTVFLMTDHKYSYLSSSLVKQVAMYNGDVTQFVPPTVQTALKEKL